MRLARHEDPAWRRPTREPSRGRPAPDRGEDDVRTLLERRVVEAPTDVLEALRELLGELIEAAEGSPAGAGPGRAAPGAPPTRQGEESAPAAAATSPAPPGPPHHPAGSDERLGLMVAALSRDLASSEAEVERLRDELDRLLVAGMKNASTLRTGILGSASQRKKKLSMLNRIVDDNLRLRETGKAPGDPA